MSNKSKFQTQRHKNIRKFCFNICTKALGQSTCTVHQWASWGAGKCPVRCKAGVEGPCKPAGCPCGTGGSSYDAYTGAPWTQHMQHSSHLSLCTYNHHREIFSDTWEINAGLPSLKNVMLVRPASEMLS